MRNAPIHQMAGKRTKALEVYGSTIADVGHGSWLEREILSQIFDGAHGSDNGMNDEIQRSLASD